MGLDNIIISTITKMELTIGATNKADLTRIDKKLNRFSIALINDDVSLKAVSLVQKYALSHGLAIPDALIAATAIINNLELFTYNTKDYKFISELVLFK